ncbi:MAG: ComEC/Rec2 family competence protein, partial [Paludibacteraceae bacterium]|nr:ComEC/Rec2 family competence protein [Paludibacteraceae bacterium]
GLPASVVRSALMFSLISVAVIIERRNVSLNAVFTSAFIMLMYKPLYLFDVGFQLSYAAVISILLFYPKIYSLLTLKSRLLNIAWSMICVSAAAQIGTLPLTVYYFHQIPTYSLLTNFLVVPAAFIIIYTSAIMLIVSPLQTIAGFAGLAADTVTTYLRTGVEYIVNLPYSVIDGLRVSGWMVIGMFAAILTFYAFTESRRARDLMASLSIVAILQLIDILIQIKVVTLPI